MKKQCAYKLYKTGKLMMKSSKRIVELSLICNIILILIAIPMPFTSINVFAESPKEINTPNQLQSGIEYQIGARRFFKENYINKEIYEFILVSLGDHCAIWVQYILWVDDISQSDYDFIRENVDKIYSKMSIGVFNHANSWGDVDNDGRINILLCDLSNSGVQGYYEAANLTSGADSNSLDIIYIDLSSELGLLSLRNDGGKELWADIAHEFQHMLYDIVCMDNNALTLSKALWFNESLSAVCAYLFSNDNHYIDDKYYQYFLLDYGTDNGFLFKKLGLSDGKEYLMTTLFGIYMYKQYGEGIVKELYANISNEISAEQLLLKIFPDKYSDFQDLFSSFVAATVFDGISTEKYAIYSEKIIYNGKEYEGLYELRLDNTLLYSFNLNIGERIYTNCKWQEKVFYYNETYFDAMNRLNFDTNADYLFYHLVGTDSCSVFDSEIKIDSDEVVALFVNCESDSLTFKTIVRNDKTLTKNIVIIVASLIIIISFSAIITVIILYIKRRGEKNEG